MTVTNELAFQRDLSPPPLTSPPLSLLLILPLCHSYSPSDNTWLGFGLSGSESATFMIGADATIVWVDREDQPHAEDYYLSAYTQVY